MASTFLRIRGLLPAICWMAFGVSAAFAQPIAPPPAQKQAQKPAQKPAAVPVSLEDRVAEVMAEWQEHREQEIVVLDIKGLSGSGVEQDGRAQLEYRLKTLLNKKRSNREWKDFWAKERLLAEQVIKLYTQLGGDPSNAPRAKALAAAKATLGATQGQIATLKAEIQGLDLAVRAARPILEASIDALKAAARQADATAASRGVALKRLQTATARAKRRLERLAADAPEPAREAAQTTFTAAELAERTAQEELETLIADAKAARAGVLHVQDVLAGRIPTTAAPGPPAAEALGTFTKATGDHAGKGAALQAVEARLGAERKAVSDAEAALFRVENRRPLLEGWVKLAAAKVGNQDVYYAAITQDIEAVEERLSGYEDVSKTEFLGKADPICSGEAGSYSTSYARHHACIKATNAELSELDGVRSQTEANLRLTEVQTRSGEQLLAAQKADERLASQERALAGEEAQRATMDPSEEPQWRTMWQAYAERTADKEKSLRDAVRSSKSTMRVLKVNAAFYATELKNTEARIAAVTARLTERSELSKVAKALFKSIWEYARLGYMVPIYILLCWLLVRFTHRVSNGLVMRARAAHEADDEEVDLDDVQRVETLTVVGGGAARLILYVATALLVLDALTFDIGPILGGAAIFGLAISFGSQSLVKDVVTGFFILLENQYAVGDVIKVSGLVGTVEKVTLRRTVLRAMNGSVHNVPNGSITSVSNMTQGWSRVVVHLGVGYGSDLDEVKRVVDAVGVGMYAEDFWKARLEEPPQYIGVTKFDDSAITVRVMFKTETFENWGAERHFNYLIKAAFDEAGISIPFPQRELHIVSDVRREQS